MAEQLTLNTFVKRADHQIGAEVDEEVVLMNLNRGYYYGLGEVGTVIWRLLEQPCSIGELCDRLQSDFEVDRITCENDVIEFIDKTLDEGLVEVV